jgi:hypothetical protein
VGLAIANRNYVDFLGLVRELLTVIVSRTFPAFTADARYPVGLIVFQGQVAIPAVSGGVQPCLYGLAQCLVRLCTPWKAAHVGKKLGAIAGYFC